jgi:hypothetical protein
VKPFPKKSTFGQVKPLPALTKVRTPDGVGTIVMVDIEANGLYYDTNRITYRVWYGIDNTQNGWIACTYHHSQVTRYKRTHKEK